MNVSVDERLPRANSTIGSLLREAAGRYGDAPFITDRGGTTISRAEVDREANRFARALAGLGLPERAVVGVFSPNSLEFVIAGYGVLRSGYTLTPFNSSYRRRELIHQITDSGAAVVFVDPRLEATLAECLHEIQRCRVIRLERGFWAAESAEAYDPEIDPLNDLAFLPYSSGTTGFSKGVELTHANLTAAVRQILYTIEDAETSDEDAIYLFLPLYHIYGFNDVLNPALASGSRIHLRERWDIDDCLDTVEKARITSIPTVPPILLAFLAREDLEKRNWSSVRYCNVGAAPVALPAVERFRKRTGVAVRQGYGMTETAGIASLNPLDAGWDPAECAGIPVMEQEMKIVDLATGERDLSTNETGELLLRGPNIMRGYFNKSDENAHAIRDGWFYTGDVGSIDERGRLHLVDRKREMIKYKGFQVLPAELESVILELPEVRDCAVVGVPDEEAGEAPKAFVALHKGRALTAERICEHVASQVAGYKRIRQVEFIDAVPRSPAGKILRSVLTESS